MKTAVITSVLLFIAAMTVLPAHAGEQAEIKLQEYCPVMGGKINKDIYADHDGKRVYFCCSSCVAEFKKDPQKYIDILENEGITLEKVGKPQTKCPVMGGDINREIYTDHEGKRIYFCCEGCKPIFEKAPEKYLKKMEEEGVTLEDAPGA